MLFFQFLSLVGIFVLFYGSFKAFNVVESQFLMDIMDLCAVQQIFIGNWPRGNKFMIVVHECS